MHTQNSAWWKTDPNVEPHERLMPLVGDLERKQSGRYRVFRRMIAMYEYGAQAFEDPETNAQRLRDDILYMNMAQNGIDTLHAQMVGQRLVPLPLTDGGSFLAKQAARQMQRALEAELDANDYQALDEDVSLDSLLCGTGIIKDSIEWCDDSGKVHLARVSPTDLYVDQAEARYGQPRCIYQRHVLDKYVALDLYGGDAPWLYGDMDRRYAAIENAGPALVEGDTLPRDGQVIIWEAYHLSSGPEADDGRLCIAMDGVTLAYVPWEQDCFPYTFITPKRPREGFWGLPVMRNYAAAQREFEKIGRRIQESVHRTGTHLLCHESSGVTEDDWDNGQKTVVTWKGPPHAQPQPITENSVNPQTIDYWRMLASMALEYTGTSAYAAKGQIPAGLQASGRAQLVFQDAEARNKLPFHRVRERAIVQVCKRIRERWKEILEVDPKYAVRYNDSKTNGYFDIKVKDAVQFEYTIKVWPVSALSRDPAQRFAELDMLLDRGAITIEQFKEQLDLPDIKAENDIECSNYTLVDKNLNQILFKNADIICEPFDEPAIVLKRGPAFYRFAEMSGAPEERLAKLRNYMLSAQQEQERVAAAMAPPLPPEGMAPPEMAPEMGAPPGPVQ